MTSRKRRAEEPASSPRSYKQPRLIPRRQRAIVSESPDRQGSTMSGLFSRSEHLFFPSQAEIDLARVTARVTAPFLKFFTFSLPIPSSPHPSTQGDTLDNEDSVDTSPISPQTSPKQKHGNVQSPSRHNSPTTEEASPFHGSERDSQSTPKAHHGPSASMTTTYSDTQPSSITEDLLVEDMNNIRLDSTYSSLQSSQITSSSLSRESTVQSKEASAISRKTRFRPRSKPHISHRQFKVSVREGNQEALKLRLFQVTKRHRALVQGRPVKAGMGLEDFRLLLQHLKVEKRPDSRLVRDKSPQIPRVYLESGNRIKRSLAIAKATLNSPKRPVYIPPDDPRKALDRIKDAAIEAVLRGIPDKLPPNDEAEVDAILQKRGVVAKFAREQVSDADVGRLRPGQWLNDEIINFYGAMILARSEGNKENAGNGSLDVHYFSTFFWAKLFKEGYERGRLGKWTKKINIFSKDTILIPINHSNAHWTAAAINFRKRRVESYDSMGVTNMVVFNHLRAYLDAEHRDKKKKPFDFTGWENYGPENIPQQANGWDCGVFTSHFLEAISRGEEEFAFRQRHMPYLRRRMIWEIGNAQLRKANYK